MFEDLDALVNASHSVAVDELNLEPCQVSQLFMIITREVQSVQRMEESIRNVCNRRYIFSFQVCIVET